MRSALYPMVRAENDPDWLKHCGFLDLTMEQFMAIQETLLLQQLERVAGSPQSRKIMGTSVPGSVNEFRRQVPLTSYRDYLPEFESGLEDALPEKPYTWAHTSGASGTFNGYHTPGSSTSAPSTT